LFIHRNFFSSADQVAWVYDPHTDEEGCFGWIDEEVHRISSFSMIDNNGDGVERTPKEKDSAVAETSGMPGQEKAAPAWLRRTTTVLSYVFAVVLGFAIAYFLFPRLLVIPIDPATGEPVLIQPQTPAANSGRSK
jgi:hypothetical protein